MKKHKLLKNMIITLLVGVILSSSIKINVSAATFTRKEISYNSVMEGLHKASDKGIEFYKYSGNSLKKYRITSGKLKKKAKYSYNKAYEIEMAKTFEKYQHTIIVDCKCDEFPENSNNVSTYIYVLSKDGKVIKSIKADTENTMYGMQIFDVYETNEDIIYVSRKLNSAISNVSIKKINKNSGKITTYTIDKKDILNQRYGDIHIIDGKIYILGIEKAYEYSLSGKLLNEFKLPGGAVSYYIPGVNSGDLEDLNFNQISACGKYIYYSNVKGVYRCKKNSSKGFELFYDARKDSKFKKGNGIYDFCVASNERFYVVFMDHSILYDDDVSGIVEYNKK